MTWGVLAAGLLAAACSHPSLVSDPGPQAIAAGDFTGLIRVEGCGPQPQVMEGYTYCRMTAGPVGALAVTFVAPPQTQACAPHACAVGDLSCDPQTCVDFTLFYPDGRPAYAGVIPRGQTQVSVAWQTLTGATTFQASDTGFWLYTYTIRWTDAQGFEQKTVSDGEIRLRVVSAQVCDSNGTRCQAYVPLRKATDDPSFAWSWPEGSTWIRMTTAARTSITSEHP